MWHEFAHLLGDQDAIDETRSSNHTLEYIELCAFHVEDEEDDKEDDELPINRGGDKVAVARKKVIRLHFNGKDSAQKLIDMSRSVPKMPQLLHWIGKEDSDLSLMYGFLCGQPGLLDGDTTEKKARCT
ncbi:hypothetical protein ACHAXN_011103 [Cyclotella atomus]